jgi:hypothetical protein
VTRTDAAPKVRNGKNKIDSPKKISLFDFPFNKVLNFFPPVKVNIIRCDIADSFIASLAIIPADKPGYFFFEFFRQLALPGIVIPLGYIKLHDFCWRETIYSCSSHSDGCLEVSPACGVAIVIGISTLIMSEPR